MKSHHSALIVASVVVLCGCGVVTDPAEVEPEVYVETAEPDPDAAAVFGQDWVDDAVEGLTDFAVAEAFPAELLDPERVEPSRADLASDAVLERLTPEAAQAWETLVDAALGGDEDAANAVRLMRYYGVDQAWTLPEDEPVASQQVTDVEVAVDDTGGAGQELLLVTFDHSATLSYLDGEEPVTLVVDKEMEYALTTTDGRDWLIADFGGVFEVDAAS